MKKIFSIVFALVLVVSLGLVTAVPMAAQSTILGHFKCYPAWGMEPIEEPVYLEDQFGSFGAVVGEAEFFCNPVAKWVEEMPPTPPIVNLDNHLTLYSLDHEEELQERIVEVENQFGTQQLVVSDPVLLGVPTWKLDPGDHDPPVGLDHFLLYEVVVNPFSGYEMVLVGLEDQFLSEYVFVSLEPVYFANPVRKSADRGVTEIENPEAHLVFYRVESGYTLSREVWVSNQFDEFNSGGDPQWLEVYMDESYPALLAVPSEKVSAGPTVYPVCNIDTGKGYLTIQAAIDDPETLDGHTIEVAGGEYDAFQVIGKKNISIISTEGATVTTPNYFTGDIGPITGDGWVMAAVNASENINIEGINFDGARVSGKKVFVGIAYVDSTGSIANLGVENVIATELGAGVVIISAVGTSVVDLSGVTVDKSTTGVAILNAEANLDGCTLTETDAGIVIGLPFDGFDPSTVNIQGSTIADNYETGIWVCDDSILEAHFNNIVGNGLGVLNDGVQSVDATYNWWGDDSGPYHGTLNPHGMGDQISDNVDFEPWLGVGTVTKTVTNSTVDAVTEADTEVEVKGTATVTIARYATNPHPPTSTLTSESYATAALADFVPLDIWRDVRVTNAEPGTEIEMRLYYTDGEVAAANVRESSLRLRWHNDDTGKWEDCSLSNVVTEPASIEGHDYSGYMWAKITAITTPSLADLQGTPWGGYGHPKEKEGICFIATAAYGTDTAKEIDILREFRDEVMLPNALGAKLVSFYYRTSPPVANFISRHEVLRTAVRVGFVDPIVKILNWSYDLWSARAP